MKKMISKFKERLANAKNNEGGFTLVELIVVIVILAILIGVTVGGVNKKIATARVNTDINNAASIQSVLSTIATEEDVYKAARTAGTGTTTYTWTNAVATIPANTIKIGTADLANSINALLTDGLPESKTGDGFTLTFTYDATGAITVKCVPSITPAPAPSPAP